MAKAINTKAIASHQAAEEVAATNKKKRAVVSTTATKLKAKKFSLLTAQEKDELLRAVALQLGLIED